MKKELAVEFFKFVTRTLPNLLSELDEPSEALVRLGAAWDAHRNHQIADRSAEVAQDRAEVDAKLAKRKASAKRATRRKTPKKED